MLCHSDNRTLCYSHTPLLPRQIVDMIREYLHLTESSKNETEELERLASQLSLSETPEQVGEREREKERERERERGGGGVTVEVLLIIRAFRLFIVRL